MSHKSQSKNCWITGAHGFIGRNLARHLASVGWRVSGLGHGAWAQADASSWGVEYWLNGDVSLGNLAQLEQVSGYPEAIFHLAGGSSVGAALTNPLEDFRRTAISTSELLEWMRQKGEASQLLAISSAAVYGAAHAGPIAEEVRPDPISTYGTHKLLMEELCQSYSRNYGLSIVIPRLFSVYGPGLRKQLLWDLCEKMASETTVVLGGTGAELRDWIDVRDVARILEAITATASGSALCINVATGRGVSVNRVAAFACAAWGNCGGRHPKVEYTGKSREGDPFSLVADVSKMEQLGPLMEVSLEQGISEYIAWYKKLRNLS